MTVTTRETGRVDRVEVPASCERAAFPTACAWYPQLPLTGAHVEVVKAAPAPASGREAPAPASGRGAPAPASGRADAAGPAAAAPPPSRLRGAA